MFEPGQSHIADKPHRLFTHREICVHLAEVSTSENLHNRRPSTLLKSIPVENERCGCVCVCGGGGGGSRTDIPRLAVQTAGIGASFPADAHDFRHGRQKFRFRLFECSPTHKKKWVTLVAQGAPRNAPGGFSRSRRALTRVGKRASCTLSSCPTGCTNEKRSPPKREVGRRSSES